MFDTSHFAPLFRQLAREKPRHSTTMPAFFAGDLTKNRRKLLGRTFEDTPWSWGSQPRCERSCVLKVSHRYS